MCLHIGGFQKMTLLDFPGRIAAIVFAYGCNLRCPYCHNASLVSLPPESFSEDEVLSYLKKRSGILDGVCISGGEPLLQPDIGDFIGKIRDMGYKIKLDTNGTKPDKLAELISGGLLDYIAMDIKAPIEKYARVTGVDSAKSNICESIRTVMGSGVDYEFRTTVVREWHGAEDILAMGEMIRGAERWFLQCFLDSGKLVGSESLSAYGADEMRALRELAAPFAKEVGVRGI